jgi:tetratricopeptide (TPR) repeat protein
VWSWVVLWLVTWLGLAAPAWATRQQPVEAPPGGDEGEVFLERWQSEAARRWAETLLAREPEHTGGRYVLAQALFYLGRYQEALATFDQLLQTVPHPRFQAYREFVAHTIQSVAGLQPLETAHFQILLDPERDAALVPYVTEVLERSYERLGEIFQFKPTEKIRVEIFPTQDTFYPASSLSARDIEVSGAVGICKFDKIMLLSPRNLARGYRWTDALSHEYIHYILVHISDNKAPIWLHEGVARYFEDAWRLPQRAWLTRRTESLLAHALRNNSFVGFKNMEPSLVKLETTYQVQLAYAEAASAIDFIMHKLGTQGLGRLFDTLRSTSEESASSAVAKVMGGNFETFQAHWRQFLADKRLQEYQGIRLPRFELKTEGKIPADEVQQEIQSTTARMHSRLGDRLRQSGRLPAAGVEYRRALEKDPQSPYLLNKLATILMAQGQTQQALPPLLQAQEWSEDDVTTSTNLGRLYLSLHEYDKARLALEDAVQINPFDPAIHGYLAEIYRQVGHEDKAQQEHKLFEHLQRTQ